MNAYEGPPITPDEELARSGVSRSHATNSLFAEFRFERALIKRFDKDGNSADIEMEDGQMVNRVRVHDSLESILFFLGELESIRDIPCVVFYRSTIDEGFLMIGEIKPVKKPEKKVNKPFYL